MELKWLIVFSLTSQLQIKAELHCYSTSKSPYLYFSTKTSYEVSRAFQTEIHTDCTPVYLWALIRHGTRYPSLKTMKKIKKLENLRDKIVSNHAQGRGQLCHEDLENIAKWEFHLTDDLNYELSSQGKSDLTLLARRLKNNFPRILNSSDKNDFILKSSEMKRAKDSGIAFTNELLGTEYHNAEGNNITEDSKLLLLSKHCPRFETEIKQNSSIYHEVELFKKSKKVENLVDEVDKRLGFTTNLTYSDVIQMYHSCAYENAWYVNSRPAFCAVFTEENIKVLEYLNDLQYYYLYGYGHPMNKKMGCVVVRDMMMTLTKASQRIDTRHKASLYFSHSETIVPTIVKLGLNRDEEPLRHDNFDKMRDSRKWKLTFADSFAANIIAVLYTCPSFPGDENRVAFYQNEQAVNFPGCPTSPCSLKLLQTQFEDAFNINLCNTDFCQVNKSCSLNSKQIWFSLKIFIASSFFISRMGFM